MSALLEVSGLAMHFPVTEGLLGRRVGETVSIQVPAGTMKMEILEVRFEEE